MRYWLFLIMIFFLPTTNYAAGIDLSDKVSMDLNMRYRLELDKRYNYNADIPPEHNGANEYNLMRTQLGFKFLINEKVFARIKLQDSRYLGTTGSNKESSSSVEMHEAYVIVDEFMKTPLTFQLGRFEMLYGRRRIMGNGNWNNFGPRAYDGFRLMLNNEEYKIHIFGVKVWDRGHGLMLTGQNIYDYFPYDSYKWDRNLIGVAVTVLEDIFHPLLLIDWDNVVEYRAGDRLKKEYLNVTTGAYTKFEIEDFRLDLDYYYQSGKYLTYDRKAWLFAGDFAYTFDNTFKPYIGVGVDITSGNSLTDLMEDKEYNVFEAPFMSKHAFRGYMDFFSADQQLGLKDYMIKVGVAPQYYKLDITMHNFSYQQEYTNFNNEKVTAIGREFDIRWREDFYKNFSIDAAFCYFIPDDDWRGSDFENSSFFYLSFITKF